MDNTNKLFDSNVHQKSPTKIKVSQDYKQHCLPELIKKVIAHTDFKPHRIIIS